MIEITKENINFEDKHWENEGVLNHLNNNKIIKSLFYTALMLSITNGTLVYIFYKILIKL